MCFSAFKIKLILFTIINVVLQINTFYIRWARGSFFFTFCTHGCLPSNSNQHAHSESPSEIGDVNIKRVIFRSTRHKLRNYNLNHPANPFAERATSKADASVRLMYSFLYFAFCFFFAHRIRTRAFNGRYGDGNRPELHPQRRESHPK